ncbi:MAG: hypothetical protein U0414_06800 [Polyangiaceae bacterium]
MKGRRTPRPPVPRGVAAACVVVASQALAWGASCGADTPSAATPAPVTGLVARYEMRFREDMTIDVVADFEPGLGTRFILDDGMDASLESIAPRGVGSSEWTWSRNEFEAPGCAGGCTIRYHYDLPKAAARFDTGDMVEKRAGAFVGTPSIWLVRPMGVSPSAEYTVGVTMPDAMDFEWGLARREGRYVGVYDDADESPYAAMGKVRRFSIGTESQGFDVMIAGPDPAVGLEALLDWARGALANVQTMFPAFPRVRPMLVIMVRHGDGIADGTALGNGGASIRIEIGDETTKEEIAGDWMLTHEMTHLTLPGLRRQHHWAEEGMAVYLEPIMRAKRGVVPVSDVWKEWFRDMHKGEPRGPADPLDGTKAWGRTYWGGAIFWLECDVAIRSRAPDPIAIGLPSGFQSVFTKGDISNKWSIEKLLGEMDAATGATIVSETYAAQAPVGVNVDLDALWKKLGVSVEDGKTRFDDTAPLSAVRKAIVVGPTPTPR